MKTKDLLLIIDMQNDFCLPTGALYVPGAEYDVANLAAFISASTKELNSIIFTQDYHSVLDISHPEYWRNIDGEKPNAFTQITLEDIDKGTWIPQYEVEWAKEYLHKLEKQGEFPHIIWPEHCIKGSYGAAIVDPLLQVAMEWERLGKRFQIVQKGVNPHTEHFGALRANIAIPSDNSTQLNNTLVAELRDNDRILIAGEAKSHCVANTIKQILELDNFNKELIILEDTMSPVPGFENIADSIYEQAIKRGAIINTTAELMKM